MRTTAYGLMLFFISLNIGMYLMNQTAVLGSMQQSPYSTPTDIAAMFVSVDVSGTTLLISGALITAGIVGWLAGGFVLGAATAVMLGVLNMILTPIRWIVGGFPQFLGSIGVDASIVTALSAMMAFIWFWFFIGFLSQRTLET